MIAIMSMLAMGTQPPWEQRKANQNNYHTVQSCPKISPASHSFTTVWQDCYV